MLTPGTVLQNRYAIERLLAQGGMGAVYLARDERLDSLVALKETLFSDERLSRAFEREARLLARLSHPALPRVSDHFIEENGQFLIMEYIPGEDLAEMLKDRAVPFPYDDVIRWADQLLDALEYLHSQEPPIVHRDIKPQNLKLTERGQIILLDFGLAKRMPLQMTRVTSSGSIYGYTPNYAPMEQIQGSGTDPRSDLYSLGATLYHLVTGATPPDALTRAAAVVEGQPDPLRATNEVNTQVSFAVAAALQKALALSRNQRPATAAEMRCAMRTASDSVEVVTNEETAVIGGPSKIVISMTQPIKQPRPVRSVHVGADGSEPVSEDQETELALAGAISGKYQEIASGAEIAAQANAPRWLSLSKSFEMAEKGRQWQNASRNGWSAPKKQGRLEILSIAVISFLLLGTTGFVVYSLYLKPRPIRGGIEGNGTHDPGRQTQPEVPKGSTGSEAMPNFADEPLVVTVAATGDSWIRYQVDDGKSITMVLKKSDTSDIGPAKSRITLNYGNRTTLKIKINDRVARFPDNAPPFSGSVVISRDNLRSFFQ